MNSLVVVDNLWTRLENTQTINKRKANTRNENKTQLYLLFLPSAPQQFLRCRVPEADRGQTP